MVSYFRQSILISLITEIVLLARTIISIIGKWLLEIRRKIYDQYKA